MIDAESAEYFFVSAEEIVDSIHVLQSEACELLDSGVALTNEWYPTNLTLSLEFGGEVSRQAVFDHNRAWYSNLDPSWGSFEPYDAPLRDVTLAAKNNAKVFSSVRSTNWHLENTTYMVGAFLPLIVFFILALIQVTCLPYAIKRYDPGSMRASNDPSNKGNHKRRGSRRKKMYVGAFIVSLACAGVGVGFAVGGSKRLSDTLDSLSEDTCLGGIMLSASVDLVEGPVDDVMGALFGTVSGFVENYNACPAVPGAVQIPFGWQDSFSGLESSIDELVYNVTQKMGNITEDVISLGHTLQTASSTSYHAFVVVTCSLLLTFVLFGVVTIVHYTTTDLEDRGRGFQLFFKVIGVLGYFILVLLWCVAGFSYAGSAVIGDFCRNPQGSLEEFARSWNASEPVNEYIPYYATCVGETGASLGLSKAKEYLVLGSSFVGPGVDWVQENADALRQDGGVACIEAADQASSVERLMILAWALLVLVSTVSSCVFINTVYQEVVYDDVCGSLSQGLRWLRLSYLMGGIAIR
jgi:hypothetical protein